MELHSQRQAVFQPCGGNLPRRVLTPETGCSETRIFHKAIVPELLASEESSHVKDGNWSILNFAE